ncbi:hypothetical protein [Desulfuribacillus alkaliarsenatis]|uniref:Uncharacterized protein n=1 Tax=Desulfuribacillus alkaliarsenatis TaxID=766136 RepID=A0A1E5FYZ1_9FIRM|nr:hypothetical protein [Desulfuribacillus alkaliarsenatis]OEF95789.1 hypothetical protein BHF68_11885 [Desulfuribacillus alkaliarsenatis]
MDLVLKWKKTFSAFTVLCNLIGLALAVYIFGTIFWDYNMHKIAILALLIMSTVNIRLIKACDRYYGETKLSEVPLNDLEN